MNCPDCGKPLIQNSSFCNYCGKKQFPWKKYVIYFSLVLFIITWLGLSYWLFKNRFKNNKSSSPDVSVSQKETVKNKSNEKSDSSVKKPEVKKENEIKERKLKKKKITKPKQKKKIEKSEKIVVRDDYEPTQKLKKETCKEARVDFLKKIANQTASTMADAIDLSIEKENEIGEKLKFAFDSRFPGRVKRSGPVWEYVTKIGRKIEKGIKRKGIKYEYAIVETSLVNAFALAGGKIYIFRGLLNALHNEAQIAGIIAHEISHVDLKHCTKMLRLTKGFSHLLPGQYLSLAIKAANYSYSTEQEKEADANGLKLAWDQGYSPFRIIKIFRNNLFSRQKNEKNDPVSKEISSITKTHPDNDQRACFLNNKTLEIIKTSDRTEHYVGKKPYRKIIFNN